MLFDKKLLVEQTYMKNITFSSITGKFTFVILISFLNIHNSPF